MSTAAAAAAEEEAGAATVLLATINEFDLECKCAAALLLLVGVLVFVFDVVHEINAVREARKLNVPLIALVDTNADPSLVDYPIPSNDDAIRTIQLIADYLKSAIDAGKASHDKKAEKAPAKTADKDEK